MKRTLLVTTLVTAVASMTFVAGAHAVTPPINGSGTVSCALTGSITFSTPLHYPGTGATPTYTLRTSLKTCSGTGNGANILGGSTMVQGTLPTNDCLALESALGSITSSSGPLKWRVQPYTPKLAPSTIALTTGTGTQGPPITIDTTGSATAGSFAGDTAASHIVIKQTYTQLATSCLGLGLKTINFIAPSNFALSSLG